MIIKIHVNKENNGHFEDNCPITANMSINGELGKVSLDLRIMMLYCVANPLIFSYYPYREFYNNLETPLKIPTN
jgi:hypothetical protein